MSCEATRGQLTKKAVPPAVVAVPGARVRLSGSLSILLLADTTRPRMRSPAWLLPLLLALLESCAAFTPYTPTPGWKYHLEAVRTGPGSEWPNCRARFLSFPGSCDSVDLWDGAGENQQFELELLEQNRSSANGTDVPRPNATSVDGVRRIGLYRVKLACGAYLGYSTECDDTSLSVLTDPSGEGVVWGLRQGGDGESFEWSFEAEARTLAGCPAAILSAPEDCGAAPESVALVGSLAPRWLLQVAAGPASVAEGALEHVTNTDTPCADPFVWTPANAELFWLVCSHGRLPFSAVPALSREAVFSTLGNALPPGTLPPWASGNERWAPETGATADGAASVLFFSDRQTVGPRRVGWSWAVAGPGVGAWSTHAPVAMDLGESPAGEIDQHFFRDDDGRTYFLWKTDDNDLGDLTTRLWAQEILLGNESVEMVGEPVMVMDSDGLWWVDSWVPDGTLIEGPQVVKHEGLYYLFFASGRFCEDSYMEGVGRSSSIFGPYEKMAVPLLSTGIVGFSPSPSSGDNTKLIGPGHASFVEDAQGQLWAVYHASHGNNCNRYGFIDAVRWGADGWPRIEF